MGQFAEEMLIDSALTALAFEDQLIATSQDGLLALGDKLGISGSAKDIAFALVRDNGIPPKLLAVIQRSRPLVRANMSLAWNEYQASIPVDKFWPRRPPMGPLNKGPRVETGAVLPIVQDRLIGLAYALIGQGREPVIFADQKSEKIVDAAFCECLA